jgi:epoxide hydrolase-like predicted phosphatase
MIKAVLFDYCGVLTEGGKTGSIRRNIAELTGRPSSEIEIGDLHDRLVRSDITEGEYFAQINRRYPARTPIAREGFIEHSDIFVRSKPVYALAAKLRKCGLHTAILSNMYGFAASKLRAEGSYDHFSPVILSHEQHMAKPDRAIFELALRRLHLQPEEVIYIDDQERFRSVVEALGMHFIVAASPQQIVRDTKALLLKENELNLES